MPVDWRRIRRPGLLGWVIHLLGLSLRVFVIAGLGVAFLGVTEQSSSEDSTPSAAISSGLIEQFKLSGQVWSLAFSADNRQLAAATITGEVIVKDLSARRTLRLYDGPMSSVLALAFSPRGNVLAFTSAKPAVRLWNAESRAGVVGFETDVKAARSIAFSPDGAMLAIGEWIAPNRRWVVSVWDLKSRRRIACLEGDRVSIKGLTFSPDGKRLAVGDNGGSVTLWDVNGWSKSAAFQAHGRARGGVVSLAFAPDDSALATAGNFESTVRLWQAATGRPTCALTAKSVVHTLCFSPDGALLLTAHDDGNLGVWDHVKKRQLGAVKNGGGRLHSLALSGDGRLLATGSADGTVRLWDFEHILSHLSDSGDFELSRRQMSGHNQEGRVQVHRGVEGSDGGHDFPEGEAPSSRSLAGGRSACPGARDIRSQPAVHGRRMACRCNGRGRSGQPILATQ
jgi:WD40 repeat protein